MKQLKIIGGVLVLAASMSLVACHGKQADKPSKKAQQVITVTQQTHSNSLFYASTLYPLHTVPVLSPVDGHIYHLAFHYGTHVKKGQLLAWVSTSKLDGDYRQTLNEYFSKKSAYQTSKANYKSSWALYKAGVTSNDAFQQAATTYATDQLSFDQARNNLEHILGLVGVPKQKVEALNLNDTKKINELLNQTFKRVKIVSPASGLILSLPQSSSNNGMSSDGTSQNIQTGSQVHQGGAIASIGDTSSLTATFSVSELDINRLHVGAQVRVTGVAFPGLTLHGVISSISLQAKPSQGQSSLSQFSARISIPKVSAKAQKIIHVGMTAKIKITIVDPPTILLPIAAVVEKMGNSYVYKLNQTGKAQLVPVTTGQTTLSRVAITSGLKVGDKVVIR